MISRRKSKGNDHHQKVSSDKKPQNFFKIILPFAIKEKKLEIPKRFVMKFQNELSAVAILTVPDNRVWRVVLENIEGRIWLTEGWQKLVKYYSIKAGHILVFRYGGSSCFHVHIYDRTTCEIDYSELCHKAKTSDGKQFSVKLEKDIQDDDSLVDLESIRPRPSGNNPLSTRIFYKHSAEPLKRKRDDAPHQNLNGSPLGVSLGINKQTRGAASKKQAFGCMKRSKDEERSHLGNGKTLKQGKSNKRANSGVHELPIKHNEDAEMYIPKNGRPAASLQMEGAIYAAGKFKPESPAFMFILRPERKRRHVYVPAEFSRKYWSQISGDVTLQVSDGREWPVKCCKRNKCMFLRQGWYEFMSENQLEDADVCVFELIETNTAVFKVSLFRAVEHADV